MKKEEKTKLTYEKIMNAAIEEFGKKSYEEASINNICSHYQIPKGLIYHNFKNKDALYLECIKKCLNEMTHYLQNAVCLSDDISTQLSFLVDTRQKFFKSNPRYSSIFFHSLLNPPKHLMEEIKDLRKDYDTFLKERYTSLLQRVSLSIQLDKAVQHLIVFQEMYNNYFRTLFYEENDMNKLIDIHETKISELIHILLYGIILK